jgi:uncharacterized phage protein gp47/JayE
MFTKKRYKDITESILAQITKGLVSEKFDYLENRTRFRLQYPNARSILKTDGILKGAAFEFRRDTDYRLSGDMVEWLDGGEKPDDRTQFTVFYYVSGPESGITDVNPGTVTRTIVEAIALEMEYMYAQMGEVYDSGFIDTASGKSLDLVVSLLGITRKMAGYAGGEVTFWRVNDPPVTAQPPELFRYDGKDRYELKNPMVKEIRKVEAQISGEKVPLLPGADYDLADDRLVFLPQGRKPDGGSSVSVDYATYARIVIPANTVVSTRAGSTEQMKQFRTIREGVLAKNGSKKWEATVQVMALVPGKEGNVHLGGITQIPKPVAGVDYVINDRELDNGTGVESDVELRERARKALEMAGKATEKSLKAAVQGVKGVSSDVLVIGEPDGVPGYVQIIAGGGDEEEIRRVIDDTRSAGIFVDFRRPDILPLNVRLTVVVVRGTDKAGIKLRVKEAVAEYLNSLGIGEDVAASKIIHAALGVPGVKDVRDVYINDSTVVVEVKPTQKGEMASGPDVDAVEV